MLCSTWEFLKVLYPPENHQSPKQGKHLVPEDGLRNLHFRDSPWLMLAPHCNQLEATPATPALWRPRWLTIDTDNPISHWASCFWFCWLLPPWGFNTLDSCRSPCSILFLFFPSSLLLYFLLCPTELLFTRIMSSTHCPPTMQLHFLHWLLLLPQDSCPHSQWSLCSLVYFKTQHTQNWTNLYTPYHW